MSAEQHAEVLWRRTADLERDVREAALPREDPLLGGPDARPAHLFLIARSCDLEPALERAGRESESAGTALQRGLLQAIGEDTAEYCFKPGTQGRCG